MFTYLLTHKLFSSCIQRYLVSRACDWVMPSLSAVLIIFSFQFSLLFFNISLARPHQHCGVLLVLIRNIAHRTLPKIWVGSFLVRNVHTRRNRYIIIGLSRCVTTGVAGRGWTDGRARQAQAASCELRPELTARAAAGAWLTRRAGTSRLGRRTGGQRPKSSQNRRQWTDLEEIWKNVSQADFGRDPRSTKS